MQSDECIGEVEVRVQDLFCKLNDDLPEEIGRIVGVAIGINNAAHRPLEVPLTSECLSGGLPQSVVTSFKPPDPLRWAPRVITLGCLAYERPIDHAVPVAACFRLLGIVSSALDAVQDGHEDLIGGYSHPLAIQHSHQLDPRSRAAVVTNAGVAIAGVAWRALLRYGPDFGIASSTLVEIGSMVTDCWAKICQAQHLDLTLGRQADLTLEQYDEIVAGKAGEIGGAVCEAIAVLAGATSHRTLWHSLGSRRTIAQQLNDDHNDLEKDLESMQQISQSILYGLAVASAEEKQMLLTLLQDARSGSSQAMAARSELIGRLENLGALQYALLCALAQCKQALQALNALSLPPDVHTNLRLWILDAIPDFPVLRDALM